MTKHVHVSSSKEAWKIALGLIPEGVSRDEADCIALEEKEE